MVKLVGILNVTPDSFSDGGLYNNQKSAAIKVKNLIEEGADIIDIGAESTRPGAVPIDSNEEKQRLSEILPQIINYVKNYNQQNQKNIEISLDSRHYQTIKWASSLGIDIINDVSGFDNQNILELVAKTDQKLIIMHNLGVPADKNIIISPNKDPIKHLKEWVQEKLKQLSIYNINPERLIFDPGIGFGKNAEQSIDIIENIEKFHDLEIPLFIGHSKKSFLDKLQNENIQLSEDRDIKTLKISEFLAKNKVDYLRIHDVEKHKIHLNLA